MHRDLATSPELSVGSFMAGSSLPAIANKDVVGGRLSPEGPDRSGLTGCHPPRSRLPANSGRSPRYTLAGARPPNAECGLT